MEFLIKNKTLKYTVNEFLAFLSFFLEIISFYICFTRSWIAWLKANVRNAFRFWWVNKFTVSFWAIFPNNSTCITIPTIYGLIGHEKKLFQNIFKQASLWSFLVLTLHGFSKHSHLQKSFIPYLQKSRGHGTHCELMPAISLLFRKKVDF
jgi:hypothetical protein